MSAIHFAAATGDTASLRTQLDSSPELVNIPDDAGSTPLHYAASSGHLDAVQLLLAMGAATNARNAGGATPFEVAQANGHQAVADLIAPRSPAATWDAPVSSSVSPPTSEAQPGVAGSEPWLAPSAPNTQLPGYSAPSGFGAGNVWPPPPVGSETSISFGDGGGNLPSRTGGMINMNWIPESFEIFKRDPGVWIASAAIVGAVVLVMEVVGQLFSFLGSAMTPGSHTPTLLSGRIGLTIFLGLIGFVVSIAAWYGQIFLQCGMLRMANASVRGEPLSINMVFSGMKSTPGLLATTLLVGLFSMCGLIACIIGAYFVQAMLISSMAVAADGQPSMLSITKTFNVMKSQWLMAFVVYFAIGVLLLVSLIPCGLGALVVAPMYFIVTALAYRDVIGMPSHAYSS